MHGVSLLIPSLPFRESNIWRMLKKTSVKRHYRISEQSKRIARDTREKTMLRKSYNYMACLRYIFGERLYDSTCNIRRDNEKLCAAGLLILQGNWRRPFPFVLRPGNFLFSLRTDEVYFEVSTMRLRSVCSALSTCVEMKVKAMQVGTRKLKFLYREILLLIIHR